MSNTTGFNLNAFYGIMRTKAPLYAYQFSVEFIGLDSSWGISNSSSAAENISYYVQSATIPGVGMKPGTATYLGTKFNLPGVAQYSHDWTCTVMLTENLRAYKGFRNWQEQISSLKLDGGGFKGIPNVQARISILDTNGEKDQDVIVLEGVWPKSVGDITLAYADGGGNPINNFNIGLKYQYNYLEHEGDPLRA